MVTAQYVYATITNIVANRDNIVLTTKLGYVIIEDILLPSSHTPEPDETLSGGQPDFEEPAQPVLKVRSRMMKKSHFCQIL